MRKPNTITNQKDIDMLLNLNEESACKTSLIMNLFGEFNGKAKYFPYDNITIPAGAYGPEGKKNKKPFRTTIGIWIFNKAFIEGELFDIFRYINKTIDSKQMKKITADISAAVLEDRLPLEALKNYLKKTQKFMPYVTVLSPSYNMKMLTLSKTLEPYKKQLLKKYEKEIKAGDEQVVIKIQEDLMNKALEIMDGDPSMDMFNSGAIGSIGNNFKNLFVIKGLTKDPDPNKGYNVITSSYMEGIKSEEYSSLANSLAAGPYARAKKTQDGGYWEKLLLVAGQHLRIVSEDCGTKRYLEVDLTSDNIDRHMYNYIYDGNKLVELTYQNKEKYIGKRVKMRYSSLCEEKKGFCRHCIGNLFNRLEIKNVGLTLPQMASKLKNISMKSFHDSQVETAKLDYNKIFS